MDQNEFDKAQKRRISEERKELLRSEYGRNFLFYLDNDDDSNRYAVEELNRLLGGVGVRFSLSRVEEEGYTLHYLKINVRENNVKNIRTRYAGRTRNEIFLTLDGKESPVTVNMVKSLIDGQGAENAARTLGMSKAGMYKRLKASLAKRTGDEDDVIF